MERIKLAAELSIENTICYKCKNSDWFMSEATGTDSK